MKGRGEESKVGEKGVAMKEEWDSQRWRPGCWEASEDPGMIVCDLPALLALFKGTD